MKYTPLVCALNIIACSNWNHAWMKIKCNRFLICHSKHNDFFFFLEDDRNLTFSLSLPFQVFVCMCVCVFVFFKQSFLTTLSCHYLQLHIPVFQSFSHTVHDLMAGLMSCSLHVEGHRIVLMNHEKGKHTSLCELFNNQLAVIHTVHLPKVCSINKQRYWMFH